MLATQSDSESSDGESSNSRDNRFDQNDNYLTFVESINSGSNLMHDIEYDDDVKCELASLHSSYKAMLEESLKIKTDSIKVHNRALKVNELDNSLNT